MYERIPSVRVWCLINMVGNIYILRKEKVWLKVVRLQGPIIVKKEEFDPGSEEEAADRYYRREMKPQRRWRLCHKFSSSFFIWNCDKSWFRFSSSRTERGHFPCPARKALAEIWLRVRKLGKQGSRKVTGFRRDSLLYLTCQHSKLNPGPTSQHWEEATKKRRVSP